MKSDVANLIKRPLKETKEYYWTQCKCGIWHPSKKNEGAVSTICYCGREVLNEYERRKK